MALMSALRLQVYDHTGRTDKATQTLDGLNFGIDEILKELATRDKRLESNVVLSANSLKVTLPTDYFHIVEARFLETTNENSYPITILAKREFVRRIPLASAMQANKPVVGYEELGEFFFAPPSLSTYTIRFTTDQRHTTVSAGASNPIKGFDLPLVYFASHYIYDSIQMFDQANVYLSRFRQSVSKSISAEEHSPGWDRIAKPFRRDPQDLDPTPWLNPFKDYTHHGHPHGHLGCW